MGAVGRLRRALAQFGTAKNEVASNVQKAFSRHTLASLLFRSTTTAEEEDGARRRRVEAERAASVSERVAKPASRVRRCTEFRGVLMQEMGEEGENRDCEGKSAEFSFPS